MENIFACVNWNEFKEQYASNSDSGFIGEAMEVEDGWLSIIDEGYSLESVLYISDITDMYLSEMANLDTSTAESINDVLGILSIDVGDSIWDLPRYENEDWLYSVLSPNTVNASLVNVEAFKNKVSGLPLSDALRESLSSYLAELQPLLNICNSMKGGLIVLTG